VGAPTWVISPFVRLPPGGLLGTRFVRCTPPLDTPRRIQRSCPAQRPGASNFRSFLIFWLPEHPLFPWFHPSPRIMADPGLPPSHPFLTAGAPADAFPRESWAGVPLADPPATDLRGQFGFRPLPSAAADLATLQTRL